jgi:hydroxybutyrate-dimer hydrolase
MYPEFRRAGLTRTALTLLSLAAALAGCNSSHAPSVNEPPEFAVGTTSIHYDGLNDDLLTGGIGKGGLGSTFPPVIDSPPTPAQVRRLAIYTNYRALVDTSLDGGYGTFYGPNVSPAGEATADAGMVAGTEFTAYDDDGTGTLNVTMVAQVPDAFNGNLPCLVVVASPDSRGVYGGISTAEWALKRGCAVVMTDKGTGAGPHDLKSDAVYVRDGTRVSAAATGASGASAPQFRTALTAGELASFNAVTPNRFAFKHAHSGRNPEADWGMYVLHAAKFGLYAINQAIAPVNFDGSHQVLVTSANTWIIAAGASTGGGAAIAAAEEDTEGLIDAVAVSEPNLEMPANADVKVQRGTTTEASVGRVLYDYDTVADMYQLCASQSPQGASAPGIALISPEIAANRCTALHDKGLLSATTVGTQGDESLQKLLDAGWEPESSYLHTSMAALEIPSAYAVTYANAYARAKVSDNLCDYSFAATTDAGAVTTLGTVALQDMAGNSSGMPPSAGVQIVNNASVGGALRDLFSTSPSTGLQDANLDGVLCLRNLMDGSDTGAQAVHAGIDATRLSGHLNGKPVVIVHGRADALMPVNHTSRPYAALEHGIDGSNSKLSYVEVTNAQHFDALIGLQTAAFPPAMLLPGYDTHYVPLFLYQQRALDAVYAYLKSGTPLPPSQVVHTVPRGGTSGTAPALAASNVPAIASAPVAANAITYNGSTIVVPE